MGSAEDDGSSWTCQTTKIMAQYPKMESLGSIGFILLGLLEVQDDGRSMMEAPGRSSNMVVAPEFWGHRHLEVPAL